jgi:hypothetical protein
MDSASNVFAKTDHDQWTVRVRQEIPTRFMIGTGRRSTSLSGALARTRHGGIDASLNRGDRGSFELDHANRRIIGRSADLLRSEPFVQRAGQIRPQTKPKNARLLQILMDRPSNPCVRIRKLAPMQPRALVVRGMITIVEYEPVSEWRAKIARMIVF